MTSGRAVKRLFGKVIVALLIMLLCGASLAIPVKSAKGATATQINTAITNGILWLAPLQQADGSWTGGFAAYTGFAIAVLEHYAEKLGKTPLDLSYAYATPVQKGLNYLFSSATYDATNHWVYWDVGGNNSYQTGPCLMPIARSGAPDAVVNVSGCALNGFTYKQVAQMAVDWLGSAQITSGDGTGAWYYTKGSTTGDQSATGWATMGLGYAAHSMGCTLPAGLLTRLATWNEFIQWHTAGADFGGAAYTSSYIGWYNVYKNGHLLFAQALTGLITSSQRVQDALTFMNTHWDDPTNGSGSSNDYGWRGNPTAGILPSYIATAAASKGFTELGIETFNGHDWYNDFATVIVANQSGDGHWLGAGHGEDNHLSTCWALLTLLRATSHFPPIVTTGSADGIGLNSATLHGNLTDMGTATTVNLSFQYGTTSGSYANESTPVPYSGTFPYDFSVGISGLTRATTYYFRAKAVGDATGYGDESSFTTLNNFSPVITEGDSISRTMSEDGSPTAFSLTLNATDVDSDSDMLTWSISAGAANGTATASGTGLSTSIGYAPNLNYNGSDSFVVQVSDGNGGTDTITVNVTVDAVNDAPSFTKGADQTVLEDCGAQTVAEWATGMSAGPADESGQTLNFIVSNSNNALFSAQPAVSPTGVLIYTPAADANGSATVTLHLHDDGGTLNGGVDTSADQTFTITVTPVVDIVADAVTTNEDTAVTISVLANDTFEGTPVVTSVSSPSHGAAGIDDGTTVTYTPFADYNGTDSFTYTVTSPAGITEAATVTITVIPHNDAPVNTVRPSITLDTHAPVVVLSKPLIKMVTGTTLNVEGSITDDLSGVRSLTIDGIKVIPSRDGTFTASIPLKRGLNIIAVVTLDNAGNRGSFTWTLDLTSVQQPHVGHRIDLTIDKKVMVVDAANVTMDVAPVILQSRTFLPLRALVEELGGSITWNAATRQVTVTARGVTMVLTIGKNVAVVNGKSILIDPANSKVVPIILGSRTFLPARFIAEQLGLGVAWDAPTRMVTITWES